MIFINRSNEFELGLKRMQEISCRVDSVTLPPELIGMINNYVESANFEENKEEDIIEKESILRIFHQELSDRVMFSTQLARSLNKSIKTLEEQIREKVFKMISEQG